MEFHRVLGTTLAHGAQRIDVAEHVGQRNHRRDHTGVTAAVHAADLATTAVQVTDHVTHVVFGGNDFDFHDGLEQRGFALRQTFAERCTGSDLERQRGRVHVMVCTVVQGCFEVDAGEAGDNTVFLCSLKALFNAGDVFFGNRTTGNVGFEDEAATNFTRFEADDNAGELTRTTGLLLVGVVDFTNFGDRLAVRNLRRADVCFDFEFALHTVDDDVEVKFTHAAQNGLTRFLVGVDAQGRIFRHQTRQRHTHFLLVRFRFRLDSDRDYGLGEGHTL